MDKMGTHYHKMLLYLDKWGENLYNVSIVSTKIEIIKKILNYETKNYF